ncbi:MAG: hypothetical protein P9M06_02650 [Candidatus Saelkia tenebricola]|nr:hypothetical protein [Candidatus Saelkia tenebricola]
MPKKKSTVQNYDNWTRIKENISDLFLDLENIRLQVDGKTSQNALINDLFLNEDAMQILESIVTNRFFPDEFPVIIKENNKFIVIDGNRRVAALKVLLHPEIVPSKETKIRELIKKAGSSIKKIEVVLAPDRDSVRHFLASKHTHNTRRPWKPLRQAYFYKAELARSKTVQDLRNEYPNVNIDKFLKLINIHRIAKSIQYDTAQVAKKVHSERSFPASTIERLYEDKQVRNFLGFDFDKNGEVKIQIRKKEFEKGFKKIVQDVADKVVDSRALNTEKNRKEYLAKFSPEETPKKTKSGSVTTSKDFKEILPPARRRTKLAPKDIEFTLKCPGVRRMLNELQKIDYHKFPNASHDLLRSFLECALKAYYDQKGIKINSVGKYVYLDVVLKEFKKKLDSEKNIELSQVTQRIISNTTMMSYTAQFLNATNHNPSVFAVAKDVEDAWDTMEKLFRHILNPKKK